MLLRRILLEVADSGGFAELPAGAGVWRYWCGRKKNVKIFAFFRNYLTIDAFVKFSLVVLFAMLFLRSGAEGIAASSANGSLGPSNDKQMNATDLGTNLVRFFGNLYGATNDSGEPWPLQQLYQRTVWFRWKAPTNGIYLMNPVVGSADVHLYQEDGYTPVKPIVQGSKKQQFEGTNGQSFFIAVGESMAFQGSIFEFEILAVNPSPLITHSWHYPWSDAYFADYNVEAVGEEPLSFQWFQGQNAIAGATNRGLSSSWIEKSRQEIWVKVTNRWGEVRQNFPGVGIAAPPPVNDAFENALVLTGKFVEAIGRLDGATVDEPDKLNLGKSIWWKWSSPESGWYRMNEVIKRFQGTALENLVGGEGDFFHGEKGEQFFFAGHANQSRDQVELTLTPADPAPYVNPVRREVRELTPGSEQGVWVEVEGAQPITFQWFTNGVLAAVSTTNMFAFTVPEMQAPFHVSVLASNAWGTSTQEMLKLILAPTNNDFATRTVLPPGSNFFQGTLFGASFEPGEPQNIWSGGSLWFEWTAMETGLYRFAAGMPVTVYEYGTNLTELEVIAVGNYIEVIPVETGHKYIISLVTDGYSWMSQRGIYKFSATKTDGKPIFSHLNLHRASVIEDDIILSASAHGLGPFIYTWKRNGQVIYSGHLNRLLLPGVDVSHSGEYSVTAQNQFGSVTGVTHIVEVPPKASNDNFSSAVEIRLGEAVLPQRTQTTLEGNEPFRNAYGRGTLWYKWVAPSNGTYYLDLGEAYAFTGATLESLVQTSSSQTFRAREGNLYYIQVFGVFSPPYFGRIIATDSEPKALVPKQVHGLIGTSISLSAYATGLPPMTYQWFKNGQAIRNARGPWLNVEIHSRDDEGPYSVEVANAYGINTSEPFTLKAHLPGPLRILPETMLLHSTNTLFQMDLGVFNSVAVEQSSDLATWKEAGVPFSPWPLPFFFQSQTNSSQPYFYRLRGLY